MYFAFVATGIVSIAKFIIREYLDMDNSHQILAESPEISSRNNIRRSILFAKQINFKVKDCGIKVYFMNETAPRIL